LLVGGEETLTFSIDWPKKSPLSETDLAVHLAFGAMLRSYRFDLYRSVKDDERPTVKKIAVATRDAGAARKQWPQLSAVADGIFLARDLVNEPPNILDPEEFARRAQELRKLGVTVEILEPGAMKKLGMNALLGVAQGSAHPPRLAV